MFGFGFTGARRRPPGGTPASAPQPVTRNAIRLLAPGHGTGTGQGVSTGSAVYAAATYINDSGAPIAVASPVFIGWFLSTTGTANIGNDVPVQGRIEYPAGTTVATFTSGGGGSTTITIPNGGQVAGDSVTLSTPIPAGASFDIQLSCTIASGQKYPNGGMLGLAGLNSTTPGGISRARVCGFGVGDSIATNNGSVFYSAAAGRFPMVQMSISGATAQTYGQSEAADFAKQTALMAMLGVTDLFSDFGTNDMAAGSTLGDIQGYLQAIRSAAASVGVTMRQCTILPRISEYPTTATAVGAMGSGNAITVTVPMSPYPHTAFFTIGFPYTIAGANESGYNGHRFCTAIDEAASTVTFVSEGVGAPTATGTLTITAYNGKNTASPSFQYAPGPYASGASSMRGQINAWIRGAAFDGFIDWADACEPSRDSGRWVAAGESGALLAISNGTVTSRINDARFDSTGTAISGNQGGYGLLQWTSGANVGRSFGVNGTIGGDITLGWSTTANSIVAGDTFRIYAKASYASDDGTHPAQSIDGKGGQQLIQAPTEAYFTALVA